MKHFFNVPFPLKIAVLVSIIMYFSLIFWLNKIPPIFENADKISELLAQICLSIITGYFFYVVVNQIKENKDKENMKPFIQKRIENIYGSFNSIYTEMTALTDFYTSIPPQKLELDDLLKRIDPIKSRPKVRYGPPIDRTLTWFELLVNEQQKTRKEINRLLNISSSLDSKLIQICNAIEDCNYFFWLDQMNQFKLEFNQFSNFSEHIFEYINLCTSLQKYAFENNLMNLEEKELKLVKRIIYKGIPKSEAEKLIKNNIA